MTQIIARFCYNGTYRTVAVEKATDAYVQGKNLHADAKISHACYSRSKMSDYMEFDNSDESDHGAAYRKYVTSPLAGSL